MAAKDHLVPFKKGEDERRNVTGLNAGVKHRSTIARKWLELELSAKNPLTGEMEKLSQEDILTLTQIKKAQVEADTNAYKAIMDSAYGAPKQEVDANVQQTIIPLLNVDPLSNASDDNRTTEDLSTKETD